MASHPAPLPPRPAPLRRRALEEGGGNTEGVMRADVRTHPDGTSRGWGILTMGTPADAQTVIEVSCWLVVD